jgi:hypothetical protein
MGMASSAKYNSKSTNAHPLVTCVEAREIPSQVAEHAERKAMGLWAMTPNWEVLGSCGHRLVVFSPYDAKRAQSLVAGGKRKRCTDCPKKV